VGAKTLLHAHSVHGVDDSIKVVQMLILQVPFAAHMGMDRTSLQGHIEPERCG
jgi:hypothetical protein